MRLVPQPSSRSPRSEATCRAAGKKPEEQREQLLWVLSAATFLIFFQAYMVAPLIPRLSAVFHVSAQTTGLMVPAYLIPYGASTLVYGLLSDHLGQRRIMLGSLLAFVALTALTATAQSASQMTAWRLLTGVGASGVVPLALALMGDLFPFERRGRPLGWLFGAMAGGMAFGSTFGVLVEPLVGWRSVFLGVSVFGACALVLLLPYRHLLGDAPRTRPPENAVGVLAAYGALLGSERGRRTYAYVFLNAIFHSGVFTWLGLYFSHRFGIGEVGIGLALLGYGVPGLLLGPPIGRAADRWGRRWLIPSGLAIGGGAAIALIPRAPLVVAALTVTVLSLGYDMTQPLLAGIVTTLGGRRGGQAMGLNVFTLFTGFGLGSLLFGAALPLGFSAALATFGVVQLAVAFLAVPFFRREITGSTGAASSSQPDARQHERPAALRRIFLRKPERPRPGTSAAVGVGQFQSGAIKRLALGLSSPRADDGSRPDFATSRGRPLRARPGGRLASLRGQASAITGGSGDDRRNRHRIRASRSGRLVVPWDARGPLPRGGPARGGGPRPRAPGAHRSPRGPELPHRGVLALARPARLRAAVRRADRAGAPGNPSPHASGPMVCRKGMRALRRPLRASPPDARATSRDVARWTDGPVVRDQGGGAAPGAGHLPAHLPQVSHHPGVPSPLPGRRRPLDAGGRARCGAPGRRREPRMTQDRVMPPCRPRRATAPGPRRVAPRAPAGGRR